MTLRRHITEKFLEIEWLGEERGRAISEYTPEPWWESDALLAIFYNGGFAVAIFFLAQWLGYLKEVRRRKEQGAQAAALSS
jgi:hypothetical protein